MSRFQESKVIVDQEPAKIIRLQPNGGPILPWDQESLKLKRLGPLQSTLVGII